MDSDTFNYIQRFIKKNTTIQDLSLGKNSFSSFLYFNHQSIIAHLNQFSSIYFLFKDKSFIVDDFIIKTDNFLSLNNIEGVKKINDNEVMFIDYEGKTYNVDIIKNFDLAANDPRRQFDNPNDFCNYVYKKAIASKKWQKTDIEYKFYKLYKKYFVSMTTYEEKDSYLFAIMLTDVKILHVMVKGVHDQF